MAASETDHWDKVPFFPSQLSVSGLPKVFFVIRGYACSYMVLLALPLPSPQSTVSYRAARAQDPLVPMGGVVFCSFLLVSGYRRSVATRTTADLPLNPLPELPGHLTLRPAYLTTSSLPVRPDLLLRWKVSVCHRALARGTRSVINPPSLCDAGATRCRSRCEAFFSWALLFAPLPDREVLDWFDSSPAPGPAVSAGPSTRDVCRVFIWAPPPTFRFPRLRDLSPPFSDAKSSSSSVSSSVIKTLPFKPRIRRSWSAIVFGL